MARITTATLTLLCGLLLYAQPVAAQGTPPPPIQGVTGTIATEGSRDAVKKAAGAAARGVKKILPGTKGDTTNPLDVLIAGSHVVVREGTAEAKGIEAIVVDVNQSKRQITVRLPDKKTDTLRLMDASGASGSGAHVLVSLSDVANPKTYDFRRVS
jgi:hypothetical protein